MLLVGTALPPEITSLRSPQHPAQQIGSRLNHDHRPYGGQAPFLPLLARAVSVVVFCSGGSCGWEAGIRGGVRRQLGDVMGPHAFRASALGVPVLLPPRIIAPASWAMVP